MRKKIIGVIETLCEKKHVLHYRQGLRTCQGQFYRWFLIFMTQTNNSGVEHLQIKTFQNNGHPNTYMHTRLIKRHP